MILGELGELVGCWSRERESERGCEVCFGNVEIEGVLRGNCVLWNLLLGSVKNFGQKVTFLFENIPHLLADNKHYRIPIGCIYMGIF